jgi:class 3 adenylate cyclase/tetratricopeptide (TPR) repeat protein
VRRTGQKQSAEKRVRTVSDTDRDDGKTIVHGERRQITALFCDLVNSTEMAEQLDPEDFKDLLQTFTRSCVPIVRRFGGNPYETHGDGILCLFGYPISQGEDAERALRTAIDIVDVIRDLSSGSDLPLKVRIGIATGLTAVDADSSHQPTVVGETLNMAARLQSIAEPNAIVVSDLTKRLAGKFFEFADLGPRLLKGFSRPIQAWRIIGFIPVANRFHALRSPSPTQFVGRQKEMDLLKDCWIRARNGLGQVVALAGEPGIGKSRLIMQITHTLGSEANIIEYFCSPYHTNSALHPVIEHLRRIDIFGADVTKGQNCEGSSKLVQLASGDHKVHLPWLAELLSPHPEISIEAAAPQERKRKTLNAILWFLSAFAQSGPVLLVIEDAHWIDPTSSELVQMVADTIKTLPILLIISCRTTSSEAITHWTPALGVTLERLTKSEAATVVRNAAGHEDLSDALLNQILDRADGVPLFIEELTKMALESDIVEKKAGSYILRDDLETAQLPATLRDSLAARLDQLGSVKQVAQVASVIGREFSGELLSKISPIPSNALKKAIERLLEAEIIFAETRRPSPNYSFKHVIVRDAAYGSLLKADRRALHERIAVAFEQRVLAGLHIEPELLAHHYTEAVLPAKAAMYWGLAAQSALQRSANLEVIGHASKALQLVLTLRSSRERKSHELDLRLLLGAAYWAVRGFASLEVEQTFTEARRLATEIGDIGRLVLARRGLFGCYYARGKLAKALGQAESVVTLANRAGNSADLCVGRLLRGQILVWQGQFVEARDELQGALSLYAPAVQRSKILSSQIDPAINSRNHLGLTLWMLGYPDQALRATEEAVSAARAIKQPFALAMALFFSAFVKLYRGDRTASEETNRELRSVATEYHLSHFRATATVLDGEALIGCGKVKLGIAKIGEALADFRSQRAGIGRPWAISLTVGGYLREGMAVEGLASLDQALATMERSGERAFEAEFYRLRGELLCLGPEPNIAEAQACFAQAVDIATKQAARSLVLRAYLSQMRCCSASVRDGTTARLLHDVYSQFTEGLQTSDLVTARDLFDRLQSQQLPSLNR